MSASCKSLFLALSSPDVASYDVFAHVRRQTDELLDAGEVLACAIGRFLGEQRPGPSDRLAVAGAVDAVRSAREAASVAFEKARPSIGGTVPVGASTLKLFAWYGFLVRALYRLEETGVNILEEEGYWERDGWWTFWTAAFRER